MPFLCNCCKRVLSSQQELISHQCVSSPMVHQVMVSQAPAQRSPTQTPLFQYNHHVSDTESLGGVPYSSLILPLTVSSATLSSNSNYTPSSSHLPSSLSLSTSNYSLMSASSCSTSPLIWPLFGPINTAMNNSPTSPPFVATSGAHFRPQTHTSSSSVARPQAVCFKSNVSILGMAPPNVQPPMAPFIANGMHPPLTMSHSSTSKTKVQSNESVQTQCVPSTVECGKTSSNESIRGDAKLSATLQNSPLSSQASSIKQQAEKTTQTQANAAQTKTVDSLSKKDTKVPPTSQLKKIISPQLSSTSKLWKGSTSAVQQPTHKQPNTHSPSTVTVTRSPHSQKQNNSLMAGEHAPANLSKHVQVCNTQVNGTFNKAPSSASVGQSQQSSLHRKASSFVKKSKKAKHKLKRKLITDSPKLIPPIAQIQQKGTSRPKPTVSILPDFIPITRDDKDNDKAVRSSVSSVRVSTPTRNTPIVSKQFVPDTTTNTSTGFRPLTSGSVKQAGPGNDRKESTLLPKTSQQRYRFSSLLPCTESNFSSIIASHRNELASKDSNHTQASMNSLDAGCNSKGTKDKSNPIPLGSIAHVRTSVGSTSTTNSFDTNSSVSSDKQHKSKHQVIPHPQRTTHSEELKSGSVAKGKTVSGKQSSVSAPNSTRALLNLEVLSSVIQQSLSELSRNQQRPASSSAQGDQDVSHAVAVINAERTSNQSLAAVAGLNETGTQLGPNYQSVLEKTLRTTLASLTPVKALRTIAPPDASSSSNTSRNKVMKSSKVSQPVEHMLSDSQPQSSDSSNTAASNATSVDAGTDTGYSDEVSMEMLQQSIFKGMEEILQKTGERVELGGKRKEQTPVSTPLTAEKKQSTTNSTFHKHRKQIERLLEHFRKQSGECTADQDVLHSNDLRLSNAAKDGETCEGTNKSAFAIQRTDVVEDMAGHSGETQGLRVEEPVVSQPSLISNAVETLSPVVIKTESRSEIPVLNIPQQIASVAESTANGDTCMWLKCTKTIDKQRLCTEHLKLMNHIETSVASQHSSADKIPNQPAFSENIVFFGDIAGAPSLDDSPATKDFTMEETSHANTSKPPSPMVVSDHTSSDESVSAIDDQSHVAYEEERAKSASSTSEAETFVQVDDVADKTIAVKRKLWTKNDEESSLSPAKKARLGSDDCVRTVFGFASEISELNEKEKALQEKLIEIQSRLLSLKTSEEEKEKEVDFHVQKEQELQSRVRQIIRQIQQVLSEKQNLLTSPDANTDIVSQMRNLSDREYTLQQKWVGANEEITKKHIETVDIKRSLNEVKETVQVLNTKQRELMAAYRSVLKQKQDLIQSSTSVVVPKQPLSKSADASRLSMISPSRTALSIATMHSDSGSNVSQQSSVVVGNDGPGVDVSTPTSYKAQLTAMKATDGTLVTYGARNTMTTSSPTTLSRTATSSSSVLMSLQSASPKVAPKDVWYLMNEISPANRPQKRPHIQPTTVIPQTRQQQTALSPSLLPKHKRPSIQDTRAQSTSPFTHDSSVSMGITSKSSTTAVATILKDQQEHNLKAVEVLRDTTSPLPLTIPSPSSTSSWSASSGSVTKPVALLEKPCSSIEINPVEITGASGVRNTSVALSQGASGSSSVLNPVTFVPHSESVLSIVKYDTNLFTCSYDNTIHIHDSQNGKLHQSLQYHKKTVTCLELYENNGKVYLLSGSSDKTIHMYDIQKGKKYAEFNLRVRVMCICVSGDILFAGLSSGFVQLLNLQRRCFLNKHECSQSSISSVCASGGLLCTASFDNLAICWNIDKSQKSDVEKYHISKRKKLKFEKTVLCVLIHNKRLFAACGDNNLYMYNIKTWNRMYRVAHQDAVSAIRVIGTVLVSASFDRLVRCFEMEKMELLQVYAGFTDKIFSLCVADGNIYAGLMNGAVQATKLDLTVYFTCRWEGCGIRFGVFDHLKEWHVKEHVRESKLSSNLVCKWEGCSQTVLRLELLQEHLARHVESIVK